MSEDEQTPVRVAAAAVNRLPGANWLNSLRTARAAFGSVDVEGLAAEIGRHWFLEPSREYGGAKRVERSCNCGRKLTPQRFEWRHSQEMTRHEAEAVIAWLTGGGA
jgi:hypothetical protein